MSNSENEKEHLAQLASELSLPKQTAENVIRLIEEGNTVPFIARYRKEMTGGIDEVQIRELIEKWQYALSLRTRKEEVIRLIAEQQKLTPELEKKIVSATKLQQIEDLYRPYKQKRRTKATVAKEKGLTPLAEWLFSLPREGDVLKEARQFISEEKEVLNEEEAIAGALDIIAEWVSDDANVREEVRKFGFHDGKIEAKVKNEALDEKAVYEMYYEYEELVKKVVPHRVLAINRGEKEDVLRVAIRFPEERIIRFLQKMFIKRHGSPAVPYVEAAIEDSYKRLIEPSIEREIRNELSANAEEQAIHIFSENLRNLLLQPPMKEKVVLGIDPAYRTGCKLALVDETGKVLAIDVIYPTPPNNRIEEAKEVAKRYIEQYNVDVIAIGNGTASRETEQFVVQLLKEIERDVKYIIVNEAGASVYSASELGREEFPQLQVEERSAVSIARRLQDPLAELVKIDPKSVGVGQYQHDVSQKRLHESLHFVVETVVNRVGVNVNTASSSLLQYVAGLSKSVANNIVLRREAEGKFSNRNELKTIPRLGAKTFEQCIGFLRIQGGDHPLDATSIHPESYQDTERLLHYIGATWADLGTDHLKETLKNYELNDLAKQLEIGELTLKDIVDALLRPGRDPREDLPQPLLKSDVLTLADLYAGMELQGTVRNVVDFGAFVDIGVEQDGLVHISKLANRFVKHPLDVVSVGEIVTVWVDSVDKKKERIALTMIAPKE